MPPKPPKTKYPPNIKYRPALDGIPDKLVEIIIEFVRTGDGIFVLRYDRNIANLSRTCWKFWKQTCRFRYEHIFMTDKEWPVKDSRMSELALGAVRTVTIDRRHNPNDFFTDHGMELLREIPKDKLRCVRFLPTPDAVCTTDFLDYLFSSSDNLEILDIRWPLSYTHPQPVAMWRTSIPSTLCAITVAVQCVSGAFVAGVTAEILSSCPNLTCLNASCCVHHRYAGMPDLFDVTARTLRSRGVRLHLSDLDLRGCPKGLNSADWVCNAFCNIVDFSYLTTLELREVMPMPTSFLWMIANLNQGFNIREIYILSRFFRHSEFTMPLFSSLDKFTITANESDRR